MTALSHSGYGHQNLFLAVLLNQKEKHEMIGDVSVTLDGNVLTSPASSSCSDLLFTSSIPEADASPSDGDPAVLSSVKDSVGTLAVAE